MMDDPRNPTVDFIGGTRPEAIKIAPVVLETARVGRVTGRIVASGQHPEIFHQGLSAFGLTPDRVVDLDRSQGGQCELASQLIAAFDREFQRDAPSAVVVQGDTTTAMAGALSAFWNRIPVVHLEAGLRSHDLSSPFPEEANRKLITQLSSLHFAPTGRAAANLFHEGIEPDSVIIAGNTVVDAVQAISRSARPAAEGLVGVLARAESGTRRLLLVTAHRRESWHGPLGRILTAVDRIVADHPDVEVVLPVHPNPVVRSQVLAALGGRDRVVLTEPLDYPDLVGLIARSSLVLSDSGGIQEEAPSFGVPVLVLRDVTERMEALDAGCAVLVGSDPAAIRRTAGRLLTDPVARSAMTTAGNPFGDGRAAVRCEQALARLVGLPVAPPEPFVAQARPVRDAAAPVPV